MSKRIETINKYINNEDLVIDVGCDHALLGLLLSKRNIKSIASDINKNIILKRKEEIKDKNITFMVSDGLKSIDDSLYDTVVISGMGSNTIIDIVASSTRRFKKLITISNKDYYMLRKELNKLGYIVKLEEVIYEKGKYYNLILFEKGEKKYTYKEMLLGINHQNINEYKNKCKFMYKKYNKILKDVPKTESHKINILNKMIKVIEEER